MTANDDYESPFVLDESSLPEQAASEFYRVQPVYDRKIHILGMGHMGQFIAHSLRGLPNPPPVTLLFHNRVTLDDWNKSEQKIELTTNGYAEARGGFEAELARPRRRFHGKEIQSEEVLEHPNGQSRIPDDESKEPIGSLILCTMAPHVLQALSAVKHRLHKDSVILFLQNGMGTEEEVNREIFPDPETRPHYMLGVNTHAVYGHSDKPFSTVHSGFGTISVGILPPERKRARAPYAPTSQFRPGLRSPIDPKHAATPAAGSQDATLSSFKWTSYDRYLLRTLLRAPILTATAFSPPDLLQMQLEKLAIASVINPLSVMLDARNGSILYNYALSRTMRLLLAEISLVIRSLPELQYIPNVPQRFDPGRLETLIVGTAHRTRDNISSMLADVRQGGITEIEYLNGWIVRKGEEQGVQCLMNYLMLNLVKGKAGMIQMEMSEDLPLLRDRPSEGTIEFKGLAEGVVGEDSDSP